MTTGREESEARLGSSIDGKWRLDALLGYGPVASTYKAVHRNGREAALKIIHRSHGAYATVAERFLQEAYLANRIDHPGVERVVDDGRTDDGCVFLVMDLLEGESLELLRVSAGGQIPFRKARRIFDGLLEALAAVHAAGVIHRSLKPGNLFLTKDLRVVLTDFGRARLAQAGGPPTIEGPLIGTPAYMSPEQARGLHTELDARSDVWSAGAIMFTTLTGRRVHEAATAEERLALAASSQARPLDATARALGLDLDLEPRVAAVIDRALAFDKERRWPSAIEMRHAYWIASGREESDLPPLDRRRRSRASIPALALPPVTVAPAPAPAPAAEDTVRDLGNILDAAAPPVPIVPVVPVVPESPLPARGRRAPLRGMLVLLVILVLGLAFRWAAHRP